MKKSFGGGVVYFFVLVVFCVLWICFLGGVFLVVFCFFSLLQAKFLYFIIWNTAIILMKGFEHLKITEGFLI